MIYYTVFVSLRTKQDGIENTWFSMFSRESTYKIDFLGIAECAFPGKTILSLRVVTGGYWGNNVVFEKVYGAELDQV